jgi:hypothetical protein
LVAPPPFWKNYCQKRSSVLRKSCFHVRTPNLKTLKMCGPRCAPRALEACPVEMRDPACNRQHSGFGLPEKEMCILKTNFPQNTYQIRQG